MNGNIVDEWTSGTEAKEIEGLKTNEEYTLKETTAPSGYKVAAPIAFTLEADGTVKVNGKAFRKKLDILFSLPLQRILHLHAGVVKESSVLADGDLILHRRSGFR